MVREFIPSPGDLVWLEFSPQAGHEQSGQRPALALSNREYNRKTGLGLFCPLTTQRKGYPFEVEVRGKVLQGVILADQVKCLDWRVRNARFAEKASRDVLLETRAKLTALITDAS
jgi:mRNA interferase MazF